MSALLCCYHWRKKQTPPIPCPPWRCGGVNLKLSSSFRQFRFLFVCFFMCVRSLSAQEIVFFLGVGVSSLRGCYACFAAEAPSLTWRWTPLPQSLEVKRWHRSLVPGVTLSALAFCSPFLFLPPFLFLLLSRVDPPLLHRSICSLMGVIWRHTQVGEPTAQSLC